MFGIINVYKPRGMTSHDVVSVLRRITKIRQIGHTGTLDPFAEGVLPICIGKATRLIEYLADDKAYIGTIQLGKSTTTYDTEGDVINVSDKTVTLKEIEEALQHFIGDIEQYPPLYSAIKVNGKKLYEYARKGENVEIKPRKVNITCLKILNYDEKHRQAKIYIECSKGTYIRSIANDLGEILGTHGYLLNLIRSKAGIFVLENSINLNNIKTIADIQMHLINPIKCINLPCKEINETDLKRISNGNPLKLNIQDGEIILTNNNSLISIGTVSSGIFKCHKVFI